METQIIIHKDCCQEQSSEDIQAILNAITQVITEAILRSTAKHDDYDPAA